MSVIDDLISAGAGWVSDLGAQIQEWAEHPVGETVLRAIASSLTGGLAPILGPQLASVAFALPGLARGEPFDEAWWNEFCWRVTKTAEILGRQYAQQYVDQFKAAGNKLLEKARAELPNVPVEEALRHIPFDIEKFAASLGIREDMAADAISLGRRTPFPDRNRYDLETGKRVPLVSVRQALGIGIAGERVSLRTVGVGATTNGSVVEWLRGIP